MLYTVVTEQTNDRSSSKGTEDKLLLSFMQQREGQQFQKLVLEKENIEPLKKTSNINNTLEKNIQKQ